MPKDALFASGFASFPLQETQKAFGKVLFYKPVLALLGKGRNDSLDDRRATLTSRSVGDEISGSAPQ